MLLGATPFIDLRPVDGHTVNPLQIPCQGVFMLESMTIFSFLMLLGTGLLPGRFAGLFLGLLGSFLASAPTRVLVREVVGQTCGVGGLVAAGRGGERRVRL